MCRISKTQCRERASTVPQYDLPNRMHFRRNRITFIWRTHCRQAISPGAAGFHRIAISHAERRISLQKPPTNTRWGLLKCYWVYKPGSVLTAIYLVLRLLAGSSRLLGTIGPILCSSTALLRIEFTALQCSHGAGGLLHRLFTFSPNRNSR